MCYTVAKIDSDHVGEVHEVIRRCSEHLIANFDLGRYWNPPYHLDLMRKDAEDKEVCAVRSGNLTIATFTTDTKPPTYFHREEYMAKWDNPKAKALYVYRLAVLPELQGRGIGSWCMGWIEKLARRMKCSSIRLDAYVEYTQLLKFYDKLEYARKGTIWWRDLGTVRFEKTIKEELINS